MAISNTMSLPLSLLFLSLSLILVFPLTTKADIAVFSSDHGNSILSTESRRTRINGGETLTNGEMKMVVKRDCSIHLYQQFFRSRPVFVLPTGLPTRDCFLYVSNRGVLYVHPNEEELAEKPIFGEESEEGRYALVLHRATLAIFGPSIWTNGVRRRQSNLLSSSLAEEEQPSAISASADNIFHSGDKIEGSENGDVEVAREGDVIAVLRPDCTLAVQHQSGKELWSTRTDHRLIGQCKLELKSNGQLVIRDYFSAVREGKKLNLYVEVFNSGSESMHNSYICLLWVEGEMMIYGRKDLIYSGQRPGSEMATQ